MGFPLTMAYNENGNSSILILDEFCRFALETQCLWGSSYEYLFFNALFCVEKRPILAVYLTFSSVCLHAMAKPDCPTFLVVMMT